jgi:hypothetical protein
VATVAEQAEPVVRFTLAPTTGESGRTGPLLVVPLPTDARLVTAVMLAASGWWEDRYGRPLRFGPLLDERETPYGRALVLCEPEGEADA